MLHVEVLEEDEDNDEQYASDYKPDGESSSSGTVFHTHSLYTHPQKYASSTTPTLNSMPLITNQTESQAL